MHGVGEVADVRAARGRSQRRPVVALARGRRHRLAAAAIGSSCPARTSRRRLRRRMSGQWETPTAGGRVGIERSAWPAASRSRTSGGRNVAGALVFLPHVGNITPQRRSCARRIPQGTRGHVLLTDRAEVDHPLRGVQGPRPHDDRAARFDGPRRWRPCHPHRIANQIGRYSLHLHHLFGPASPPPNSYQFILIGNAIDGGTKWGITIHNTHYGLVQDNVVYNAAGAGHHDGGRLGDRQRHREQLRRPRLGHRPRRCGSTARGSTTGAGKDRASGCAGRTTSSGTTSSPTPTRTPSPT